ncbi:25533_t:CDS:1, partial [Gigaspora margarita]
DVGHPLDITHNSAFGTIFFLVARASILCKNMSFDPQLLRLSYFSSSLYKALLMDISIDTNEEDNKGTELFRF